MPWERTPVYTHSEQRSKWTLYTASELCTQYKTTLYIMGKLVTIRKLLTPYEQSLYYNLITESHLLTLYLKRLFKNSRGKEITVSRVCVCMCVCCSYLCGLFRRQICDSFPIDKDVTLFLGKDKTLFLGKYVTFFLDEDKTLFLGKYMTFFLDEDKTLFLGKYVTLCCVFLLTFRCCISLPGTSHVCLTSYSTTSR